MILPRIPLILAACWVGPSVFSLADDAPDAKVKALIEKISSDNADVRYAGRAEAIEAGAPAVVPLGKLLDESRDPGKDDKGGKLRREIAITARAALEKIVHHAGRPGGEGERRLVASELSRLLVPEETAKVKREVLHLIAFVGDDAAVPGVSRLLDDGDQQVRETARLSLERIPGPAAVEALVAAARRYGDDRKPDFLFSLGKKADPKAAAPLMEAAEKSHGKVRLAALEALARLGTPASVRIFESVLGEKDLPERAPVFNEYLRLADSLAKGNKEGDAGKIYLQALSGAPLDHQRERGLFRLASAGSAGNPLDALLLGLGDPGERVRKLALLRLGEMKGPEVLEGLTKAYQSSKPERQAAILSVLAAKNSSGVKPLIDEAAKSPQIDLKITALDLAGQLENLELEPTYLRAAQDASAQTKPIAVKGILLLAKKRFDTGEKNAALTLYSKALELGTSDEQRGAALRGLLSAGDPKAIDQVGSLMKDPVLGVEASKGFVSLAASIGSAGDKDRAEKHLLGVLTGEFSRDIKGQAAEELRKLDRDPQRAARSQGFVVDWWLLTPIQDPDGKALEKKFFPEETIDLEHEQRIEARKFVWQRLKDVSLDGRISLIPSFRRIEKVITYAYTEIDSPQEREVTFKMGSDDGIACFLNGERIHLNNVSRKLKADEDSVKAKLVRGKNKVLLKISNRDEDWAFVFRVVDAAGKPLDLSATKNL
jgi:HEAT repeat protein